MTHTCVCAHIYSHMYTHQAEKPGTPTEMSITKPPSLQLWEKGREEKHPQGPELTLVEPQNIWIEAENLRSHKAGHSFTQTLTK